MIEAVKNRLCELFDISEITGDKTQEKVYARMIFAKFFTDCGMTLQKTGSYLDMKHSSVYHLKVKFDNEYQRNKYFRWMYDEFKRVPLFDTVKETDNTQF